MSKFYTNVFSRGNKVYVRGYENGKAFQKYEYYKPYLFVDDKDGNYKTVDKKPVSKIMFNSISEAKEFVTKYKDIQNFNYYGLENFQYLYIYDNYSGDVQYDPSKMSVVSLDIECIADQGFPDIQLADKEITAITIRKNKLNLVFGCGEFVTDDPNTKYFRCKDEKELLYKFVDIWNRPFVKPDIITGWNCIPINSSLWKEDEIININEVQVGDKLYDSNVIRKFPESSKPVVVQKLSNGQRIKSSKEHIFPYRLCPKDNYTKLSLGGKSYTSEEDISVENAINDAREKFLFVNTRNNINSDYLNYNLDQCYLMGLIYTDGSLKSKNNLTHGFTFYQSDFEFMKKIKEKFSIKSKIVGPYKNCYHLHIPYSLLGDISPIYKDGKKHIDKKLISKFSEKQYMSFLSGMLDGDGYISKGKISLCNFNNDINNIYELSLWNGIFSCISENHIRFIDIDISKLSLLKEKRWGNFEESKLLRESSQKAKDIKFKKGNGGYWVRVKEIYEESDVTMIDIETDTHYFVTGGVKSHNCEFFDIPYLVNRIRNICGEDLARNLSPWRMINEGKVHYKGKENQNFILMGISTLDYYQLYRKFTFGNQESYKLDYIASVELGEKKIDYSEYGSLLELYKNNFQKFIEYNIHDVVLVDKLEEKLKFIEQVMALAYDAKVNFVDTLTTVRPWDIIIHNYLLDRKTVVPKLIIKDNNESLVGGFVKDPKVGMSEWVVSFDVNSMYPNCIIQNNIGPETRVTKKDLFRMLSE